MADPPRHPETEEETGLGPDRRAAARKRSWVVVLGIIVAIALVGAMVILHLTGVLGPGAH